MTFDVSSNPKNRAEDTFKDICRFGSADRTMRAIGSDAPLAGDAASDDGPYCRTESHLFGGWQCRAVLCRCTVKSQFSSAV